MPLSTLLTERNGTRPVTPRMTENKHNHIDDSYSRTRTTIIRPRGQWQHVPTVQSHGHIGKHDEPRTGPGSAAVAELQRYRRRIPTGCPKGTHTTTTITTTRLVLEGCMMHHWPYSSGPVGTHRSSDLATPGGTDEEVSVGVGGDGTLSKPWRRRNRPKTPRLT